jgi:hypothetical protein
MPEVRLIKFKGKCGCFTVEVNFGKNPQPTEGTDKLTICHGGCPGGSGPCDCETILEELEGCGWIQKDIDICEDGITKAYTFLVKEVPPTITTCPPAWPICVTTAPPVTTMPPGTTTAAPSDCYQCRKGPSTCCGSSGQIGDHYTASSLESAQSICENMAVNSCPECTAELLSGLVTASVPDPGSANCDGGGATTASPGTTAPPGTTTAPPGTTSAPTTTLQPSGTTTSTTFDQQANVWYCLSSNQSVNNWCGQSSTQGGYYYMTEQECLASGCGGTVTTTAGDPYG